MPHALLIGTTGMLKAATTHIAQTARRVTLIARHAADFPGAANINAVNADWADESALLHEIDRAGKDDPFGLALVWLHPRAESLRHALAARVTAPPHHYVEVLGSASSRPGALADRQLERMNQIPGLTYSQVILGFQQEGNSSRWLTHEEISAAAVTALETKAPHTIAGQVEPWDARPD